MRAPAACLAVVSLTMAPPVGPSDGGTPAAARPERVTFSEEELTRILELSPLSPPPEDETNAAAGSPAAARLGQALFFDRRLSGSGALSCATCHDPQRGFGDGRALATGAGRGQRHTPALWNVAYNRWFFWDGRADTLWSQALKPIESATELGGSRLQLVRLLATNASLRDEYSSAFGAPPEAGDRPGFPPSGGPLFAQDDPRRRAWESLASEERSRVNRVFANAGKAIAAYERRILSRRSPFDVFAEGLREGDAARTAAIDVQAQRGLKLFVGRGRCHICHSGPNFTDGEFHDAGLDPPPGRQPDPGRHGAFEKLSRDEFNSASPYSDHRGGERARRLRYLVGTAESSGQFKTPTLRNVAVTAPYGHDGRFGTLRDVLLHYSSFGGRAGPPVHSEAILFPLNLTEAEVAALVAFLHTLSDLSLDPKLLQAPAAASERPPLSSATRRFSTIYP